MNTKHGLFIGIAFILLAAIFTFTGCDNNSTPDPDPEVTYTGGDVTLTFTGHETPTDGDSFTLKKGSKTATGTIKVSGSTITFTPKNGSAFTATLTSGGVNISNALITFDDNTSESVTANTTKPSTPGGGSSLSGTYQNSDFTIVFTATNFTIHYPSSLMVSGTYTLNGTALTLINSDGNRDEGTASLNGNTLILSGFPHANISGTYTKQ
jgi:hypothetical protein